MRFANDFHSWLRHSWKSLANRLTRDPKIIIHGNSCIILYLYNEFEKYTFRITATSPRSQWFKWRKPTKALNLHRFFCRFRFYPSNNILYINSFWPSDAIRRLGTESTLAQVMACCLTAPSHYLNQCWIIISKVQWHSSECNFRRDASAINHKYQLENHLSKISLKSLRGQWVNEKFWRWY